MEHILGHEHKGLVVILLIIYVVAITFVGYANRHSKTSEDYFLASRSLSPWLLAVTFIASWWGGGSAIDLVDQSYTIGISAVWIYGAPVLLSIGLMYIFASGIRRIGTVSQSELIAQRYDWKSEFMLTVFILVFMTIGGAIQVIVVGQLFQSFFDLSYAQSAMFGAAMVIIYSLFGGFRGVVLTDLFQFFFFLFSSIFLCYFAYTESGGTDALLSTVEARQSVGYTDLTHNLSNQLAFIITFGTSWMVQANIWQRISAAKTPGHAKRMLGISFFVFLPLYLMVTLTGMFAYPLFDALPEGGVISALLLRLDHPIISALIFVGLASAIMSTMDTMFNTGALALTLDVYKRYVNPVASPMRLVTVGRISTFIVAAVAVWIAIRIQSVLTISWIGADFIATGAFIPIVAGFLWKQATSTAAFVTMVFGFIFSSYNLMVALGYDWPVAWEIASYQQALVGMGTALLIFVVTSLLTKEEGSRALDFIRRAGVISK